MDHYNYLFKQFNKIYLFDLSLKSLKLFATLFFVIICPIVIYKEIILLNYFSTIILLLAEVLLVIFAISQIVNLKRKNFFKKSNVCKCFKDKTLLNKIVISDKKVFFDIIDIEDETITLNHSNNVKLITTSLKSLFGESKIESID